MTMPGRPDPLKHLATILNGWIGGGAGMASLEAMHVFSDFHRTLDDGQKEQFKAFLGASEFWKDGRLGIDSISTTELAFMKILERKLFDFHGQHETGMAEQMSRELMVAVRGVKQACQFRDMALGSRGAESRTPG